MTSPGHAAAILLMFVVLPVWILAGFADYLCHRVAQIEHTSGPLESLLHVVQMACIGIPVLAALFLEIDAAILAFMATAILLHHAVAYADITYASSTRRVSPEEQMVHGFLEITPIAAFMLVCVLYWPQLLALMGLGSEPGNFAIHFRQVPLPSLYVAAVLAAAILLNALPYSEELIRTIKAKRSLRPAAVDRQSAIR